MKKDERLSGIMKEYEQQCETYEVFTERLKELVMNLLRESQIHVHSVTSRMKDRDSLHKKLIKNNRKFSKLSDILDISGVRIITYFADDVDLAAKMIEKEFDIDKENSVDKRELLDPDRFGYISLHYVVKLTAYRRKLTEYKRFKDCCAEIQVRSILQHAWAEIEHDLGYKSKQAVPKDIRRRFSRLAGVLEIADDEFIKIRNELKEYERDLPALIAETPKEVLIDKASLLSFIQTNTLVAELDAKISSSVEAKLRPDVSDLDSTINELGYIGINNVAELSDHLRKEQRTVTRFAEPWIRKYSRGSGGSFDRGICLFYLSYVLVGKKQSISYAMDYLTRIRASTKDPAELREMAETILSMYTQAKR